MSYPREAAHHVPPGSSLIMKHLLARAAPSPFLSYLFFCTENPARVASSNQHLVIGGTTRAQLEPLLSAPKDITACTMGWCRSHITPLMPSLQPALCTFCADEVSSPAASSSWAAVSAELSPGHWDMGQQSWQQASVFVPPGKCPLQTDWLLLQH